jgi:hypothetical protein
LGLHIANLALSDPTICSCVKIHLPPPGISRSHGPCCESAKRLGGLVADQFASDGRIIPNRGGFPCLDTIADPKRSSCEFACRMRKRRGGDCNGREAAEKKFIFHFFEGVDFLSALRLSSRSAFCFFVARQMQLYDKKMILGLFSENICHIKASEMVLSK